MSSMGWARSRRGNWSFRLLLPALLAVLVGSVGQQVAATAANPDSPVDRYLAARDELKAVPDVPPHLLACMDASLRGQVLELRGEILAIISPGPADGASGPNCLLLQTAIGVTVPLDYQESCSALQVGQRVAVLA